MLVWGVAEYQSGSSCCYVSIATAARLELARLGAVVVQPAAAAPVRGHSSLFELDVICRYLYIEECPRSPSFGWEVLAKMSEPSPSACC